MRTLISIALTSLTLLLCSAFVAVAGADEIQGWAEAICRDKVHFEDCFDWNQAECQSAAKSLVQICMFEILPPRPKVDGTIEAELQKKLGAGAWGVTLGHCGEVGLFHAYKDRVQSTCFNYFAQREEALKKTPFIIDVEKLKKKASKRSEVEAVMFRQAAASLFFGLSVPLLIAFFWWRRQSLGKFPIMFCFLLTIPSFVASFLGTGYFYGPEGVRVAGDNPTAIGGMVFGIMLLIPSYWISIGLLFWIMKRRQTRATKTAAESTNA